MATMKIFVLLLLCYLDAAKAGKCSIDVDVPCSCASSKYEPIGLDCKQIIIHNLMNCFCNKLFLKLSTKTLCTESDVNLKLNDDS